MEKNHRNSIKFHQDILERKPFNFHCRREFNLPFKGKIRSIDLGCFRENETPVAVALEVESTRNFNNPQVELNKEKLNEFKRLFGDAMVFHIHTSENIDFNKELLFGERLDCPDGAGSCTQYASNKKSIDKDKSKENKKALPTRISVRW